MKLNELLKVMFHLFCAVTTFLLLFMGLQGALLDIYSADGPAFRGLDLLKLISIGFCSVLPTAIFYGNNNNATRVKAAILYAVHFILTAGAVFALMLIYRWIDTANAMFVFLTFLVIYLAAHIVIEMRARKLAADINKKLNAFHDSENETHDTENETRD